MPAFHHAHLHARERPEVLDGDAGQGPAHDDLGQVRHQGPDHDPEHANQAAAVIDQNRRIGEKRAAGFVETPVEKFPALAPEGRRWSMPSSRRRTTWGRTWPMPTGSASRPIRLCRREASCIQVQLALEDEGRAVGERKKLKQREKKLLAAHQRAWLGELAPFLLDDRSDELPAHLWRRSGPACRPRSFAAG